MDPNNIEDVYDAEVYSLLMGVVLLVILKTSHLLGTQMGYPFSDQPSFQCGLFTVSLMN